MHNFSLTHAIKIVMYLHSSLIFNFQTAVYTNPEGIFETPVGLDPDFWSQRTRTLGPESQFGTTSTGN